MTGRLHKSSYPASPPSCSISVSDCRAIRRGTGRRNDGSDEIIASPKLAQVALDQGIGQISAIKPATVHVALKDASTSSPFSFSRVWQAPRVVLKLPAGQMTLLNVSFLVADDYMVCKDLLVGLPVLRHVDIESRTLIESN